MQNGGIALTSVWPTRIGMFPLQNKSISKIKTGSQILGAVFYYSGGNNQIIYCNSNIRFLCEVITSDDITNEYQLYIRGCPHTYRERSMHRKAKVERWTKLWIAPQSFKSCMMIPNTITALSPSGPVIARSAVQSKFETK
jgi:hypothetical protein